MPLSMDQQSTQMQSYKQRLSAAASRTLGPGWQDYWPSYPESEYFIAHHSQHGAMRTALDLIEVAKQDLLAAKQAMCVIENITYTSAIALGSAWNLDPLFFIEHLKSLDGEEIERSLKEARVPNSRAGLKSSYVGRDWGIIRGWIDHGRLPSNSGDPKAANTSKRCVEQSNRGTVLAHTNFSFYKVHEQLRGYSRHRCRRTIAADDMQQIYSWSMKYKHIMNGSATRISIG